MEILLIIVRTVIIYLATLVIIRLMGKREIAQLTPFDLVVAIMIAELAAIPMEDPKIPLSHGLIPISVLAVAEIILSYLCLYSEKVRRWVNGLPVILIENGQIREKEMRRARYNLNDLMSQLRDKDIVNIADVEYAILETSGKLSVVPKSQKRGVTPEDLGISTDYEGLPIPLIVDGNVEEGNLLKVKLNRDWLDRQLHQRGVRSPAEVVYASLDSQGKLYLSKKGQ